MKIFQKETIIPAKKTKINLENIQIGDIVRNASPIDYVIEHYFPGDSEGNPSAKYSQTQDSWIFKVSDLVRKNPSANIENVQGTQLEYVQHALPEQSYIEITSKASDNNLDCLVKNHNNELYKHVSKFLNDKISGKNKFEDKVTLYLEN